MDPLLRELVEILREAEFNARNAEADGLAILETACQKTKELQRRCKERGEGGIDVPAH
jgi:hypothetical protein